MTSFAHVDYPTEHPGVVRAENAAAAIKDIAHNFDGARGAASLLLAAVVSALMVVANQVIDTWSEGHLLAAWMVLWVVAQAWAERRRRAAEDARTWQVAMQDPRIMAELNHAMGIATVQDVRRYY